MHLDQEGNPFGCELGEVLGIAVRGLHDRNIEGSVSQSGVLFVRNWRSGCPIELR